MATNSLTICRSKRQILAMQISLSFHLWPCTPPTLKQRKALKDSKNLLQTNAATAFPLCAVSHLVTALLFIVCVNGELQSKSREMCQHVTRSGRCPSPLSKLTQMASCFLAFTRSPLQPQPPSFHPRFHLLFFLFFPLLSLPLSHHPGSHAPFVWPCLTSSSSHTSTHVSICWHTLTGHHTAVL